MEVNKYIDHTILKPETTKAQILTLCEEAKQFNFASVCVNPTWVATCANELKGTDVKVCTVIRSNIQRSKSIRNKISN